MAKKLQLKKFSDLMDKPADVGPPSENFSDILELGTIVAESHPDLIVFVDNPPLQKWVPDAKNS